MQEVTIRLRPIARHPAPLGQSNDGRGSAFAKLRVEPSLVSPDPPALGFSSCRGYAPRRGATPASSAGIQIFDQATALARSDSHLATSQPRPISERRVAPSAQGQPDREGLGFQPLRWAGPLDELGGPLEARRNSEPSGDARTARPPRANPSGRALALKTRGRAVSEPGLFNRGRSANKVGEPPGSDAQHEPCGNRATERPPRGNDSGRPLAFKTRAQAVRWPGLFNQGRSAENVAAAANRACGEAPPRGNHSGRALVLKILGREGARPGSLRGTGGLQGACSEAPGPRGFEPVRPNARRDSRPATRAQPVGGSWRQWRR